MRNTFKMGMIGKRN